MDSNGFGSGHLEKILTIDNDEVKDWFRFRRISYYHEEEKGILYLQFCPTQCPAFDSLSDLGSGFGSVLEEREFGDLQGLLFMFSVCHVIVYIQEGSRFDTQLLKKFRVLQAAKQALVPYVRSRTTPPLPSRPHSSSSLRPVPTKPFSSSSQARGGVILNRNTSSMSLMFGLGSQTSLFPGLCTPVALFVFMDDFSDMPNSGSNVEESVNNSSLNEYSNSNGLARSSLSMKGSGSVVVLSRPGSKSEGGLRKKLQSSLEAQIRFLIKKCRTLSVSESDNAGSRSGGVSSSTPLFSLDASKTVVLLDRSTNQKGEALDFTTNLVEDVLNGKVKSDSLLLETNSRNGNREDILSVKEFIYRQFDILRGKGGLINTNNSGVGMVAVAAAVAAASASSAKKISTPELPNMDVWLSCSNIILLGLLTAKGGFIDEIDVGKRKPRQRNDSPLRADGVSLKSVEPLDIASSWLRAGKGLNTKFSTLWCERALPAAKDVYLKDLPICYPTCVHEARVQMALRAFNSMVRGPSVPLFTKRLEDECTSIWKSGRQLCDAVSLTGNPCMHQRHDVGIGESFSAVEVKPHSSGYVFLHSCACGRSRRLRPDPFDFESANITFNCFPDCDKLLPSVKLPEASNDGLIKSSSWSLLRVGGARYYKPSNGLLQSGFSAAQKFLSKWTIFLEKQNIPNDFQPGAVQPDSIVSSSADTTVMLSTAADKSKTVATQFVSRDLNNGKPLDNGNVAENKISFGRDLPRFKMKKPFSEVVAGSVTSDSSFPPLQQRKQASPAPEKFIKQKRPNGQIGEQVIDSVNQGSQKPENISSHQETSNGTTGNTHPFLRIGSNIVPVNTNSSEKLRSNLLLKHDTAYIGFEHECPRGHRFLLSSEHLNQLGPSYSMPEEYCRSKETLNFSVDASKSEKNFGYGKGRRKSNRTASAANRMKNFDKPQQIILKGNQYVEEFVQNSGTGKEHNQTPAGSQVPHQAVDDLETHLRSINLGDDGRAVTLLNRNLPIYMHCPHCLAAKEGQSKIKYAGTTSQLQRIFVVTPPFPVVLATSPVVQFEESCLPPSFTDREHKLQFKLGCSVILPPDSFLALRLPFLYGVQLEDKSTIPLNPFEHEPERTAWIVKGTSFKIISKESGLNEKIPT